jgi:hypothetical protein
MHNMSTEYEPVTAQIIASEELDFSSVVRKLSLFQSTKQTAALANQGRDAVVMLASHNKKLLGQLAKSQKDHRSKDKKGKGDRDRNQRDKVKPSVSVNKKYLTEEFWKRAEGEHDVKCGTCKGDHPTRMCYQVPEIKAGRKAFDTARKGKGKRAHGAVHFVAEEDSYESDDVSDLLDHEDSLAAHGSKRHKGEVNSTEIYYASHGILLFFCGILAHLIDSKSDFVFLVLFMIVSLLKAQTYHQRNQGGEVIQHTVRYKQWFVAAIILLNCGLLFKSCFCVLLQR